MSQELQTAISHHRAGRLAEAETLYKQILAADAANAEVLQLLGLIAGQRNELPRAAEMIGRAVELAPKNVEFMINLAEIQRRMSRVGEAEETLRRALALAPADAPIAAFIWYNLGVVLRGLKIDEAMNAFQRAIALQPNLAEAHNNLAILQDQTGQHAEAVASFQRALQLRPGHADTESNLGMALWRAHRPEEAVAMFEQAIRSRPEFAAPRYNLGAALRKLGRNPEALAMLGQASDIDGESAEILRELGRALLEAGRVEEAVEVCRRGTEFAPDDPEAFHALGVALSAQARGESIGESGVAIDAIAAYARALELNPEMTEWSFELAALRGQTPANAPDAFVRSLFDDYALRFEKHLVNDLHYRVPEALLWEVLQLRPEPRTAWNVMDLGCGSGICGELFRPFARHISGIDLSPNMIEVCRRRRGGTIYDDLFCGHLLAGLRKHEDQFDVMLAGDVFIYVGGLEQVFPAAARALRAGGLLAFSLEKYEGNSYILHKHRRYAHALPYVRRMARESGLQEVAVIEAPLRDDVGNGWIVVLEKPGGKQVHP